MSGSEVTTMTVITCTSLNKKDSVLSPVCLPTLAILDPELTLGLSPRMTAITALDALAHAVESLTGGQANPLSDALAREAIRLIAKWLPVAYNDGSNIKTENNVLPLPLLVWHLQISCPYRPFYSPCGAQFDIPMEWHAVQYKLMNMQLKQTEKVK